MYIDLSMPLSEQTVVFPGDARPIFEPAGTFSISGYEDQLIHINNHLGTHIDAPGHMIENGKMLFDYDISRFVSDGICIDARGQDMLGVSLIKNAEITPNVAVLFYTGSGDTYTHPSYATNYPVVDGELVALLVKKGVLMCGVDMISFDHDAPFPNHKALLRNDVLLIENLINLKSLVNRHFKLFALPINLQLEAAPARVIAEVNEAP